ncbi:MAG: NERD domain-containing protein [Lentisphaeria bacterium]|nr:NERD domain-containing protein [Lentisphaeria bacterium]
MAEFIPAECDYQKRPLSEQMVFEEIRNNLSNDWVVFHSFDYVTRDLARQLWDGEIDFLLYHERKGFLVIEVKGGSISFLNGQWLQDGRPMDPVEQAKHNKYAVMKLLQEQLQRPVPLKFAHAVCFPSCDCHATVWPPEAKGLVITKDDLKNIENIACRLIDDAPIPQRISGRVEISEILDILSPEFEYGQNLRDRILDDDRQFFLLTRQQCSILDALRNFPKLQIEGGAGTGKTVLAIKKANMVAAAGGSVLLLCFNELLAKKIRKEVGKYHSSITVGAFFEYCVELMQISPADYEKHKNNPLLYSKVLPEFLGKFLDNYPASYDAIIVDEGQDFNPQIWHVLPRLLAPNGHFYIFYDPDQNIFRDQLDLPDFGMPPVSLSRNCRNTQKIFEALTPYRTVKMELLEHSPVGSEVITRIGDCRPLLAQELNRIFREERIIQTDVVVLGGHSLKNTCIGDDPQVGDYRLVDQPKQFASGDVAYYTYMKFKGCEAKVVILLDIDESDPRWNASGLYTAMSRAVHQLIILKKG